MPMSAPWLFINGHATVVAAATTVNGIMTLSAPVQSLSIPDSELMEILSGLEAMLTKSITEKSGRNPS